MSTNDMRDPLPAPFTEGTKLKYIGPRKRYADAEGNDMTFGSGMEGEVIVVRKGRRGTGALIDDTDGDLIYDRTIDAASLVRMESWLQLLVYADTASEWEVIGASKSATRRRISHCR